MAPSSQTHPDEGDLEDAKSFAKWVMTFSRGRKQDIITWA